MPATVYLKMEQKTQLMKQDVTVADLGCVYCTDKTIQSTVRTKQVNKIPKKHLQKKRKSQVAQSDCNQHYANR